MANIPDNVVVKGEWGTVEYAIKLNGKMPAKDFIENLGRNEKSKLSHPLEKMAETGNVWNPQKFRIIKGIREKIYEFKSGNLRLLCFQKGKSWILTNGFLKGEPARKEFKKAIKIKKEHLEVVEGKGR